MPCEEYAAEIQHVTVNNKYLKYKKLNFCGHNTNKSNQQSQLDKCKIKIQEDLLPLSTVYFFSQVANQK